MHFGWARMLLAVVFVAIKNLKAAEREAGEALLFLEATPSLRASCMGALGAVHLLRGRVDEAKEALGADYERLASLPQSSTSEATSMLCFLMSR